ncbi:COG3014 family protein [Paraferrimonas sedimenticola]|uniref:Tetratricopeptide repeat-containing protein n=1 Tax=Paraferrimonas sedimenticola TaxID=375674 RepID=A0AA37RV27_9GAMM|nr:hypothetical protein [Paraferrimonas sedimenticola]GLP95776.1 hypothetical protein GCM10007895_10820 [Paraferrimonas sedimenticola]
MPYPAQLQPYQSQLNASDPVSVTDLESKVNGEDGILYAQEAGRIAQLNGDFALSQKLYAHAIARYDKADFDPTISVSNLGANATSVLLNDNVIPYRGPGFERIMLHQYQALNYLMQGDSEGALVEVRRANELQTLEQERYRKSLSDSNAIENGTVQTEINRLKGSSKASSSFLNAYSYYVTGLLYQMAGEPNDAFIDYRKAAQLHQGNPYLEQELVRLAKGLQMPQYQEFKDKWGDAQPITPDQGRLVVIYETGFSPAKQAFSVPFRVNRRWQSVSLPTYLGQRPSYAAAYIKLGNDARIQAATISDIDDLATTALAEELPLILVRQAARVYAKAEANQWARERDDWGGVAMEVFNLISEQADLRSWLTLPSEAQIAHQNLTAGSYPLQINAKLAETIEIKPGQTTLVWAIQTGGHLRLFSQIF